MKPLANPLFVKFIIYFNHNQDFFECHEVLEDYWNTFPERTKRTSTDELYITLNWNVSLAQRKYHWCASYIKKKHNKKMTIIEPSSAFAAGINFNSVRDNLANAIQSIEAGQPFNAFLIEIDSPNIQHLIKETQASIDLLPVGSDAVIHKHLLRDRTEIIRIRDEKKKGRH